MSDTLPPDLRTLLGQIAVQLGRIDTRLDHIEADIGEIKADAKALRQAVDNRFSGLLVEMATISGRISGLPNIWQTFGIVFGVLIGLPVITAIGIFVLKTTGYIS
jgi:hypothetical protein